MSTATTASADAKTNSSSASLAGPNGVERRRRKRAKISAQVHVRAANSPEPFEELCKSIDVSRDGLLFVASRSGYWGGQRLEVTFPYSTAASALNKAQSAEVVRVVEQGGGLTAVAVQFVTATSAAASASDPALAGVVKNSPTQEKQTAVVLAVEPDPRTAEMMRGILQQDGYTVVIVAKPQDALEILKTTIPAVFLAEVENEEMSGHDLCLIIKRNERLQQVPVILLTRSAQPADYSASHQLGAVVCMAKPFKPERLLHVVRLVAPPPAQKNVYASRVQSNAIERSL